MYRCEAVSVAGFIQQLAVSYVANGYFFYVTGCVPPGKDPSLVDSKLIERYGIDCSKWVRARRKARGVGNVQYLRFRRFFVVLATRGEHDFFKDETRIQDIRRRPIQCFGYSLGCYRGRGRTWHPSVRIEAAFFRELREEFLARAISDSSESLHWKFAHIPFEPYSPVRRQMLKILAGVNRARARAAVETLPIEVLRLRRSPQAPFGDIEARSTCANDPERADITISSG
jgi:hypothetical protein